MKILYQFFLFMENFALLSMQIVKSLCMAIVIKPTNRTESQLKPIVNLEWKSSPPQF